MEFRILGPVEAVVDGGRADLGAPQLRALLARLLLSPNRVVPVDALVEGLWEDDGGSVRSLRVYVSRLRTALGDGATVVTRPPGYVLEVGEDELDAARFERLVERGRELLAGGAPDRACDALREALGLWRGPALGDVRDRPFARGEAVRLDDARIDAIEERIDADLACGRHGALAAELRSLTAEHPFRERLWRQRMLAEYRSGQPANALRTFQELRNLLVDELGLEPSGETRRLDRAILDEDPGLALPDDQLKVVASVNATRVMLVDDHPLWRTAVRSTLEKNAGIEVVAEAEDGATAVKLASEMRPDVVLMDLHLPDVTGAEAASRIVAEAPTVRVLMLSASGQEVDVLDAVKSGAAGYLLKSGSPDEIVDAIRRVVRGEPVFTASLAGIVLDRLRSDDDGLSDFVQLSSRQRDVLALVASGASVSDVSRDLQVDEEAVRTEVSTIVERLQSAERNSGASRRVMTLTFIDIVDSTARAALVGDRKWREELESLRVAVREGAERLGGRVVKQIGDGSLLVFDQPSLALEAAAAAVDDARPLELRVGVHTGECEVEPGDVHGVAVHIASRVQELAEPGEVLASHSVCDVVLGSSLKFVERGVHKLKGVPGEWRLFALAR